MQPQNQAIVTPPEPVTVAPQPVAGSNNCKHKPIIAILAILALGGFCFGGYQYWQNTQKDESIKTLKAQKEEFEEQLEKITTVEEEEITETETEQVIAESNVSASSEDDEFRIMVNNEGKACAVNMTKKTIIACADDVTEHMHHIGTCDGNDKVIVCFVYNRDETLSAKFVYNDNTGEFIHGILADYGD